MDRAKEPRRPSLPRATEIAHQLMATRLAPGSRAIDATAGNGHDTAFLAKRVGAAGEVYAFDVQTAAIEATRSRLEASGLDGRVHLFQECHSRLGEAVEGTVIGVMFNLGYLPGGDKGWITQAETTVAALEAAKAKLEFGGLMTVVVYPGHPGGDTEAEAVEAWAAGLDQYQFNAARYAFLNQSSQPPRLIAVEKRDQR